MRWTPARKIDAIEAYNKKGILPEDMSEEEMLVMRERYVEQGEAGLKQRRVRKSNRAESNGDNKEEARSGESEAQPKRKKRVSR